MSPIVRMVRVSALIAALFSIDSFVQAQALSNGQRGAAQAGQIAGQGVQTTAQANQGTGQANPVLPGGINQSPWFNNAQIRQHLNLNNGQYNGLNSAYQNAYQNYQQGITGLNSTLTPAQRQARINELQQGFYKSFSIAPDKYLTDQAQRQRYNQLYWQYRGYGAFSDPTVIDKLHLTQSQLDKLNQHQQQWHTEMNRLNPTFQSNREQALKQYEKIQNEQAGQIDSVLTPQQQALWRQLIGESYTFGPDVYFGSNPNGSAIGK